MNSLDKLFTYFDNDQNIKRLHALEKAFDSDTEISKLINLKQEYSKQMINAKYLRLTNTYNDYREKYDQVNKKLMDYPFLDEYMDLLNYYNNLLKDIINYIETNVNKKISSKM